MTGEFYAGRAAARMLPAKAMKAHFYHLQINVSNLDFYRELLLLLGFRVIDEGSDHLGVSDGHFALWVMRVDSGCRDLPFHRKAAGMNHLALRVSRREDVEEFCREFLERRKGIASRFTAGHGNTRNTSAGTLRSILRIRTGSSWKWFTFRRSRTARFCQ